MDTIEVTIAPDMAILPARTVLKWKVNIRNSNAIVPSYILDAGLWISNYLKSGSIIYFRLIETN